MKYDKQYLINKFRVHDKISQKKKERIFTSVIKNINISGSVKRHSCATENKHKILLGIYKTSITIQLLLAKY